MVGVVVRSTLGVIMALWGQVAQHPRQGLARVRIDQYTLGFVVDGAQGPLLLVEDRAGRIEWDSLNTELDIDIELVERRLPVEFGLGVGMMNRWKVVAQGLQMGVGAESRGGLAKD